MSTFTIPNRQGVIRQIGRSETAGEIQESFCVDINNPYGKIKASKKMVKVLDETDDFNSSELQALAVYSGKFWAIAEDRVLKCSTTNDPTDASNWSTETGIATSNFGDETDATVFNDLLLISRSQDILSWNGSVDDDDWWTAVTSGTSLSFGYPHTLHTHRGGQETLFVTDKNIVRYYNTTAGHSTVTLGTGLVACCIDSGVNATWVGTYSESSDNAYVYEIYVGEQLNGTPIARNAYKVDARTVLSLTVINNVPYIITEKGNLQVFNGAGFSTVASLPFAGDSVVLDNMRIGSISSNNKGRAVHPKGMQASNGSIFININTETESLVNQDPYAKNSPAGVWEYNAMTGQLHHRFAFAETSTSKGSKENQWSGPLLVADLPTVFIMAGGEIEDTDLFGLFMDTSDAFGYFTTQEIMAQTVEEAFESVYIKAKTPASGESITLKYRTTKRDKIFADGTLADSTTFNTTDSMTGIEVGDEVTVYTGTTAGTIAHITAISEGASVTSITVDTSLGDTGDAISIEVINFKKVDDTYTSTDGEYKRFGGFGINPWIQFKVIMDGEIEIREFICKGNSKTEL